MPIRINPNQGTRTMPIYAQLAQAIAWQATATADWAGRSQNIIDHILKNHLPHGSGIDAEVTLDDSSHAEKIVICFEYHHMNDGGFYDGWTEHTVIVTPSLVNGFSMQITGMDRNQVKDYLYEVFDCSLRQQHGILSSFSD